MWMWAGEDQLEGEQNQMQGVSNYQIQRAKFLGGRTAFQGQRTGRRFERGGRSNPLRGCRYLEATGFFGISTSWIIYLIYWDSDCLRMMSFLGCDFQLSDPLEQLFGLSLRVSIILCNLLSSSSSRSSPSDQLSEPPSQSSVIFSSLSSFVISCMMRMNSSLSSTFSSDFSLLIWSEMISWRETWFFSRREWVLLMSRMLVSLMEMVLAFLPTLLRNYLVDRPILFFIPVSTLALAFKEGSRISSCPQRCRPMRMACPKSMRVWVLKGFILDSLDSYRPLETQKVKVIGILIFQSMWARPVAVLCSLTVNIDFLQLKIGVFCSISFARARARKNSGFPMVCSGPQQKSPFLEECAWKSKQNWKADRCARLSSRAKSQRAVTSGKTYLLSLLNCRLRSFPLKLVLKLPATTPSGLSMGMMWKTKELLRACELDYSASNDLMNPSSMKEE